MNINEFDYYDACYFCAAVCNDLHCSDCRIGDFIDQYSELKNNIIINRDDTRTSN